MYQIKVENNMYYFINDNEVIASSSLKNRLLNNIIKGANSLLKVSYNDTSMTIYGVYVLIDKFDIIDNNIKLFTNNNYFDTKIYLTLKVPFTNYKLKYYSAELDYEHLDDNTIYNPLFISFENKDGYGFKKRLSYKILDRTKTKYRSSKIKLMERNTAIYLKQSKGNGVSITKRAYNTTDTEYNQVKIFIARIVSLLLPKNKIILYEKELSKYEESASVLYEELLNRGVKNCYFIIDKSSYQIANIPAVYSRNIIYKGSFKSLIYFFRAKTFLGTEFVDHVIDLRVKNKHIEKFISSKKYNFVFLQHGVMYMLSLSSSARQFFKKGEIIGKNGKIVVSSLMEAEHFINDGGYNINDLYITGLPKFDKNYRYKNANKIVIMLTWRPWEYHEARINPTNTTYYKSMMEIYDLIPQELKKNVIILPHPLFHSLVKDFELFKVHDFNSYDEILKNTDLLITDYSSISIDAFSRGCNVIFWWKDMEESMKKYNGYLMLDCNNIYGDICKNSEELKYSIENRYQTDQENKHILNYNKIVQFNDGKNTERLIESLKRDEII